MNCETNSMIMVEYWWLKDADNLSREVIEKIYLAVLEHDKANIFVFVVCLVWYDDLNNRFVLELMSGHVRFDYLLLFVSLQFKDLEESILCSNQSHYSENKIIRSFFSLILHILVFWLGYNSSWNARRSSVESSEVFFAMISIFFVKGENWEIELCFCDSFEFFVRMFPCEEIDKNVVEFQ